MYGKLKVNRGVNLEPLTTTSDLIKGDNMSYEQRALHECLAWQHEIMKKRASIFGRASKSVQNKINKKIPQKVHDTVTMAMKGMVQTVLYGSDISTRKAMPVNLSLKEKEIIVKQKLDSHKKTATAGGIGTGCGGLWWGLADFPLLLSVKMKFLYDVAHTYGFDIQDFQERIYLLYIFQVAFSSDEKRVQTFLQLRNWPESTGAYQSIHDIDWQAFQLEYRDHIDLAKLFQLVPGFGAIVGGIANYKFMNHLGETAINAYRMRLLDS